MLNPGTNVENDFLLVGDLKIIGAETVDTLSLIAAWRDGDAENAWRELDHRLKPHGRIDAASFAAVDGLVALIRDCVVPDPRAYALVGAIEEGRLAEGGAPMPLHLRRPYRAAWDDLLPLACRDLGRTNEDVAVRTILSVIAQAKGQHDLALLARQSQGEQDRSMEVSRGSESPCRCTSAGRNAAFDHARSQFEQRLRHLVDTIRRQGCQLSVAAEQVRNQASGLEQLVQTATASADRTERHMSDLVPQAAAFALAGEEIEQEARSALAKTTRASCDGKGVGASVAGLTSALGEIEVVVAAIDQLSRQTDLLSLNARIEASRSGEAGRGFTVVANEVKMLAAHTADLTRQATGRIAELRSQTIATSSAISTIVSALDSSEAASGAITAAVHRQVEEVSLIRSGIEAVAGETRMTVASVTHARSAITTSHDAADLMEETSAELSEVLVHLERDLNTLLV